MRAHILAVSAMLIGVAQIAPAQSADKEFIGPVPQDASSTAVKVPARRHILFLAGHTASRPKGGADYGNFAAQVKAAMAKIDATLAARSRISSSFRFS